MNPTDLTRIELIALAKWHTNPERDREVIMWDNYQGHVTRAAELLRLADEAEA